MEAQLREVQAGYRRLGDDVAFQQEQLWNQVPCLLGPPALYPGPDPDTVLIHPGPDASWNKPGPSSVARFTTSLANFILLERPALWRRVMLLLTLSHGPAHMQKLCRLLCHDS